MPLGKTLIASLIATAVVGTVAAVALGPGVPDAVVEPASARWEAEPGEDAMEFMMSGGARIVLEFDVETTQDVRMRLVLTRGETTDLFMDGPGDCDNVLRGVNLGDGRSVRIVCPDVEPGRHRVELTHRAGTVWGRLSATPLGPEITDGAAPAASGGGAPAPAATRVERIEGEEKSGVAATLPWPTCPLQCKMTYGRGGASMDDFEIGEGATRVVVTATWDALHPADSYDVGLHRFLEEKDGGRYYEGVAGATGVGSVTFEVVDLPAGTYGVWSSPSAPAGAEALRTVSYVVEVHYG